MSDSVDRVFVHALNTVKRIPRTGSARPPEPDRLRLYGLYKQSMEGDVEGVMTRPSGNGQDGVGEREKWEAWHAQRGRTRTQAKRMYISTLIETMHRYATTTPEARELVAELEFVWDQIKVRGEGGEEEGDSGSGEMSMRVGGLERGGDGSLRRVGRGLVGGIGDGSGGGREGLRLLRPGGDGDGDGDGRERGGLEEEEDDGEEFGDGEAGVGERDLDVRNRKWRRRVEQALVKMTVEVAALREVVEGLRGREAGRGRYGVWGVWVRWVVGAVARAVVVDALVVGLMVLWARRRRGDRRVERGVLAVVAWVREHLVSGRGCGRGKGLRIRNKEGG